MFKPAKPGASGREVFQHVGWCKHITLSIAAGNSGRQLESKGDEMSHSYKTGIVALLCMAVLAGCQEFTSPYTTEINGGTYVQGLKPSYSITQITSTNGPSCVTDSYGNFISKKKVDAHCRVWGKLTQTNPSSNISFQTFLYDKDDKPYAMVTCASPAEVTKAYNNEGSFGLNASGVTDAVGVNSSGKRNQTDTVIVKPDMVSRYVAVASFYNCLAYSSGMITPDEAAQNLKKIFDNATKLASTKPSDTAQTPDPAADTAPPAVKKKPKK